MGAVPLGIHRVGAPNSMCNLTSALWRVVEGAKRRSANVAHQRPVSRQLLHRASSSSTLRLTLPRMR